jgi:2-polyprenyl-3-methyl-5-hydroxy-6-metoxy-1,4-benzoquinol methylase
VLEHIAIKNPIDIMKEIVRVLKPGGIFILSTPNVCNISNIYSLLSGENIFWERDLFYGSSDRHNREFIPQEVKDLIKTCGLININMYGVNCWSNWRKGGIKFANLIIDTLGDKHTLLKNTIMLYAFKE